MWTKIIYIVIIRYNKINVLRGDYMKEELIKIANETVKISINKKYLLNKKEIHLKDFSSELIKKVNFLKHADKKGNISFKNISTISEVISLKDKENICILNFASAKHPGGGFLKGSRAQEESIARTSNLYLSLKQYKNSFYDKNVKENNPLYTDEMIYSKDITVFRDDNGNFIEPIVIDVITSPAVNANNARNRNIPESKINETMKERIRKIIYVAAEHDVDYLVLGAFGCGVFKNDDKEIARMFYSVLETEKMKYQFKEVIFAIYDDKYKFDRFRLSYSLGKGV